ncbi:ADYC domain-containing protein [Paraliomyxa miuraensis]|uniref:ADYC domain-containing protein n=1 Tax=Paraliomyxa miuraensis TaxID=376150 RepID=UPI002256ED3D|nr:ADYC domain-containing protein [Paraliomyxa miuraensis]MCX4242013.1 ADYC domain-containing protein [Paraliomyxa miuraensis]
MQSTLGMLGLTLCLTATVTGCDQDAPLEFEPAELEPAELELRIGGPWGCPTCDYGNSPTCGLFPLDRIAMDKELPNAEAWLAGILDPAGDLFDVILQDDGFVADVPTGPVTGHGLLGWTLVFSDGTNEMPVQINNIEQHEDWVSGDLVWTYALAYDDPFDPEAPVQNVCPGISPDQTSVVLIADELYDDATKTVMPNRPGWMTMACRGHAVMKMKFMGHDPNDAYGSVWQQRQAALKMITADYCGEGQSFTTLGQPLAWVDQLGNFGFGALHPDDRLEAKWSENGATCLDKPRYVDRSDVDDACEIPECKGDTTMGTARWLSFIPATP